jgi:hypothetical protein
MQVSFDPARDAFAFPNSFGNRCAIARVPIKQTRGRCGGMVFAALDHWHAKVPVPPSDELPPDGEPFGDYIHDRMRTSMIDNWERQVTFMRIPDQRTPFNRRTLAKVVRDEELPRLKALLDAGEPQPLALTQAHSMDGLADDHQVVAYGYEVDGPMTRILIWDNRYGRRADTLTMTTQYDPHHPEIEESDGSKWRGFFVEQYAAKVPPYVKI